MKLPRFPVGLTAVVSLVSLLNSPYGLARSLSVECVGIISKSSVAGYLEIASEGGESCFFVANSTESRKILKVCPIGTKCQVRGSADNVATAPSGNKIYEVDSVHRLGSPALDTRAKKDKEADEKRKRNAVFPYEERTTNCVVGRIKDAPQEAVTDILQGFCVRESEALRAEYYKQFGPGGNYLYLGDYYSELLRTVDREKSKR